MVESCKNCSRTCEILEDDLCCECWDHNLEDMCLECKIRKELRIGIRFVK